MYRSCAAPETGQDYLYNLSFGAVAFVAGISAVVQAKLAPDIGERHANLIV